MRYRGIGRLCALVLALALGLGSAPHGPQAGGTGMAAAAIAAGADMPTPDACDACDGGASEVACGAAVCLAAAALPPMEAAVTPPLAAVVAATARTTLGPGRTGPPDPFPPKPLVRA